ncbi:MAG: hypothetical protein QF824_01855 [Candidatus Woesearchaeota archaeon]|nr:hypothetical protein [Candidatus Woesearchaeota archaeon]
MDYCDITQVIGLAYGQGRGSRNLRRSRTEHLQSGRHSSQTGDHSFFVKVGPLESVVRDGDPLILRTHPETGELVDHWYEPELVILLGENHEVIGYGLGNDFTAHGLELGEGRYKKEDGTWHDGTDLGKRWQGSTSIGRILTLDNREYLNNLEIGIRIERDGEIIYDNSYSTVDRNVEFADIPGLIMRIYNGKYKGDVPPSKEIQIEGDFLPAGTVIMTGSGLMLPKRCYAQEGDIVTVYSPQIGELRNPVRTQT